MPRRNKQQSSDKEVESIEKNMNKTCIPSQFQVLPPGKFDFSRPAEWQKWKKKFERFRQASELYLKPECQQVSMFLYCLGDEGEDLLETFELTEEENYSFNEVVKHFDKYLGIKKNIVFERAKFLKRRQQPGESIDSFINNVKILAETCELGSLKASLIRDIIVIGVSNSKLSENLQMDETLTLEKAILKARQAEVMAEQQTIIRKDSPVEERFVEPVSPKGFRNCWRCGNSHSFEQKCPALVQKCYCCGKVGHYSKTCRSRKSVKEVQLDHPCNLESACDANVHLGELKVSEINHFRCPEVVLTMNGSKVSFKMDSGADVTVISKTLADQVGLKLQKTNKVLYGPGKTRLNIVGVAQAKLWRRHQSIDEDLYVLQDQACPLLSRNALIKLGLVTFNVDGIETDRVLNSHIDVFNGMGLIDHPYEIVLEDNARPYAVLAPRRVAISLHDKVKEELDNMVSEGIIEAITEPTEWCSPIVVVPKKDGRVRLCVDYTNLNKNIKRELLQLPTVDECISKLNGAKIFSKLDAANGFWQVPLTEKSYKLTTFITPFGRYFFKRLPFGICSGPEVFQRRISQIIYGLDGVINLADDLLVVGRTQHEHDTRLKSALKRLKENGVKLNKSKCQFNLKSVIFLGHLIDGEGIRADPLKTKSILEMKDPENVSELRRFLGMINYLLKFIPNLVTLTAPLRILLKSDIQWIWDEAQKEAFLSLKKAVSNAPVLTTFNMDAETRVTADASSFGLGAVLEQFDGSSWRPLAYASRSLSETESRYAQIEKEALGLAWACEKFSYYLLGRRFCLVTDHKPLVEIMGSKPVSDLSARLQRLRLRLQGFDYDIVFLAGKHNYVADCLSRCPLDYVEGEICSDNEEEMFVQSILEALPCTDKRLLEIKKAQEEDKDSQMIKHWIKNNNWVKDSVYWKYRNELVIEGDLLVKGRRLFIPKKLRKDILQRIHSGHLGMVKCRKRAQESVWWPGCSSQVKEFVANCDICIENRQIAAEPLMPSVLPEQPWTVVGSDLFKLNGQWYVVVQDYYSRFLEIVKLDRLTSQAVIARLKNIFARHGIPLKLRTDGGTQFTSDEFKDFLKLFGIELVVSSPHFPQSNGESENAVKIAKNILTKNEDPNIGLLAYRSTPLESGLSPAELLYGRKIRSDLPSLMDFRKVEDDKLQDFRERDYKSKQKNKQNFDRRRKTRELPELESGKNVWIKDLKVNGTIVKKLPFPRSYLVKTENGGVLRRNRWHLIPKDTKAEVDVRPNVKANKMITASRLNNQSPCIANGLRRSPRVSVRPRRYRD